jgi:hypothetical protein
LTDADAAASAGSAKNDVGKVTTAIDVHWSPSSPHGPTVHGSAPKHSNSRFWSSPPRVSSHQTNFGVPPAWGKDVALDDAVELVVADRPAIAADVLADQDRFEVFAELDAGLALRERALRREQDDRADRQSAGQPREAAESGREATRRRIDAARREKTE